MTSFHRFLIAGLSTLALTTVGCNGSSTPDDTGLISMRVEVGGHNIDSLHYEIVRPGEPAISGDLNVAGSGSVVSAHIGAIPVGDQYTVTLTATTVDGAQTCAGESEPFAVTPDTTTSVSLVVSCRDVEDTSSTSDTSTTTTDSSSTAGTVGDVSLDVPFNACPKVLTATADPTSVQVGGLTVLSATAEDADGQALSFSWSEGGVSFANGSLVNYSCATVGDHALQLDVSDGNCVDVAPVTVTCTP